MSRKKRILFFSEAVTLAHVVRLAVLAKALGPEEYETHFACAENEFTTGQLISKELPQQRWPIYSISPKQFLERTNSGRRLYGLNTLTRYVHEDLELMDKVQPDLVVGDMRISLATSAALRKIPYVAVTQAYWGPSTNLRDYPVPDFTGSFQFLDGVFNRFLKACAPYAFDFHARPLNQVRERFGLAPLGGFRKALTYSDHTLYMDLPQVVNLAELPLNHQFIGPVLWSPELPLPDWWESLPKHRPLLYVSLGSSGRKHLLSPMIQALSKLPINVVVAKAGASVEIGSASNVYVAEYLSGDKALERADVVVCNGGSGSVYQALHAGVPVVGVASNLDQMLMMTHVERSGTGRMIRASRFDPAAFAAIVTPLLGENAIRKKAQSMSGEFNKFNGPGNFKRVIADFFQRERIQ